MMNGLIAKAALTVGFLISARAHGLAIDRPSESTPGVIRIVVHCDAPDLPKDHFLRKPKTVWRRGTTQARVEEQRNPDSGLQLLFVVDEPRIWQVDLVSKSGKAILDPGPSLVVHLPLFQDVPALADLEFGGEREFFEGRKAKALPRTTVDGKDCFGFLLKGKDHQVLAYFQNASGAPFQIGLRRGDQVLVFVYDAYERLEQAPAGLFSRPDGITWQKE